MGPCKSTPSVASLSPKRFIRPMEVVTSDVIRAGFGCHGCRVASHAVSILWASAHYVVRYQSGRDPIRSNSRG